MSSQRNRDRVFRLFAAWGSRDPEVLRPLFHPDAVFFDAVNGECRGWPAIRAMYERSVDTWSRVDAAPTKVWVDASSAACACTDGGGAGHESVRFSSRRGDLSNCRHGLVSIRRSLVLREEEFLGALAPAT
jgi:hypothetical protein